MEYFHFHGHHEKTSGLLFDVNASRTWLCISRPCLIAQVAFGGGYTRDELLGYDGMWTLEDFSQLAISLFDISLKLVRMQETGCGGNWSTLYERLACLEDNDQEAVNSAGSTETRVEEHDDHLGMTSAKIEMDAVQSSC